MRENCFALPDDYRPVVIQEFSDGEPIGSHWNFMSGQRHGGYWSKDQAFVDDGKLVIRTEYKNISGARGYHTGAVIWRENKFTYGYYEARCKVDLIKGVWSAFWLMPDHIGRGQGYEIDIFESAWNYFAESTLHWNSYKNRSKKRVFMKNLHRGYHTFALDWKKNGLVFYYDGAPVWRVDDPEGKINFPVSLWLSCEINGSVGRNGKPKVGRKWIGNGVVTDKRNRLPFDYIIDYVKVYDNGDLILSEF